jgi:hypothetical protein
MMCQPRQKRKQASNKEGINSPWQDSKVDQDQPPSLS